jgi:hypothetical protein
VARFFLKSFSNVSHSRSPMHEHMLRPFVTRVRLHVVGAALLPLLARGAFAQDATLQASDVAPVTTTAPVTQAAPEAPAAAAPLAGPTLAGASAAVRPAHASRELARTNVAADDRPHAGRAAALMITGGAAIVLGILVGGDAAAPLIVGGAVVGALGLYDFIK